MDTLNKANLLGQGGGGRVYEGKFDGIDVAIKKILEWDNESRFVSLRNEVRKTFKSQILTRRRLTLEKFLICPISQKF